VWSLEDLPHVQRGDVALVSATDPEFLPMFRKVAAVLSVEGSPLTHTAIVARELGLPCLVGVDEVRDGPLVERAIVTVDAMAGRITHRRVAASRRRAVRSRSLLSASAIIAEVAHRLGDWTPGPAQLALARSLLGRRKATWDCAPTASAVDQAWRWFFEEKR